VGSSGRPLTASSGCRPAPGPGGTPPLQETLRVKCASVPGSLTSHLLSVSLGCCFLPTPSQVPAPSLALASDTFIKYSPPCSPFPFQGRCVHRTRAEPLPIVGSMCPLYESPATLSHSKHQTKQRPESRCSRKVPDPGILRTKRGQKGAGVLKECKKKKEKGPRMGTSRLSLTRGEPEARKGHARAEPSKLAASLRSQWDTKTESMRIWERCAATQGMTARPRGPLTRGPS